MAFSESASTGVHVRAMSRPRKVRWMCRNQDAFLHDGRSRQESIHQARIRRSLSACLLAVCRQQPVCRATIIVVVVSGLSRVASRCFINRSRGFYSQRDGNFVIRLSHDESICRPVH